MTDRTFEGLRSVRSRRDPVRAIVLHWTGGIGGLDQLYRVLRGTKGPRTPDGLSVHVGVDAEGTVEQWADFDHVCLHAGPANEWSIGFEVSGPGFPGRTWNIERGRGVERLEYADRMRGRRVKMLGYTEAQYAAIFPIVDRICDRYEIPRQVPTEMDGSLMARTMTPRELAKFRGVMGHYHCHESKCDPGTEPFRRLLAHWRAQG